MEASGQQGNHVVIEVKDDGAGLEQGDRAVLERRVIDLAPIAPRDGFTCVVTAA